MRRLLFTALLVLFCQSQSLLAESELLISISEHLTVTSKIESHFIQEKKIPYLARPLRSFGVISFDQERGLRWNTAGPIVSEMIVDATGVTLDGREVQDRGTGQLVANLLQAFATGDLSKLDQTFYVSGELVDDYWNVALEPRSFLFKSAIESIEAEGSDVLQSVTIAEPSGALTHIQLFEHLPVDIKAPERSETITDEKAP